MLCFIITQTLPSCTVNLWNTDTQSGTICIAAIYYYCAMMLSQADLQLLVHEYSVCFCYGNHAIEISTHNNICISRNSSSLEESLWPQFL